MGKRMAYTLGQAAKATGLNKATIFKALKAGKISGVKDVHGRYVIDPAELHRVYPPVSDNGDKSGTGQREPTGNNDAETQLLREKVALLERLVEQITGERDRLLLLLPLPPAPSAAAPELQPKPKPNRGIFGWFKARAA